jgi:ribosomal-protein-alanine N-acetyltransferase
VASKVLIRAPRPSDERAFLDAVCASRSLHYPWVQPPSSHSAFHKYLARLKQPRHAGFLIRAHGRDGGLVGAVHLNEIVRVSFQSAYLGYYAFEPLAGRGLMCEGLALVIAHAFGRMKLHRLEANIQPGNIRSVRLVKRLGFKREGLSPRYLKIAGRWRDHERWALLAEEY